MPSPFPGMDPYLENPSRWPGVHHWLITSICEHLDRQLRPRYYTLVEDRVYISDELDAGRAVIIPDVSLAKSPRPTKLQASATGVATVEVAEPIVIDLIDPEIHEPYITLHDRQDRSVVAIIEVVSPANKIAGARGRESFEQKRRDTLNSSTHWIEIDLLRIGTLPVGFRVTAPAHEYAAFVSRHRSPRRLNLLWPIRLNQQLPTITIPLNAEDPDATLNLQQVLTSAYERSGCEFEIDYAAEPIPALDSEFRSWADRLLKEKGVR
jgi:hypothetical protein